MYRINKKMKSSAMAWYLKKLVTIQAIEVISTTTKDLCDFVSLAHDLADLRLVVPF